MSTFHAIFLCFHIAGMSCTYVMPWDYRTSSNPTTEACRARAASMSTGVDQRTYYSCMSVDVPSWHPAR